MRRLAFLVFACFFGAMASASAQTYEQAFQRCLRKPDFEPATNKACTIVIDAPRTTALDRAIALNNRAAIPSGPDDAIRDLDQAIRLAPKLAKLYNHRGQYLSYPFFEKAIADFSEAIRLDPAYAVAWNNRGEVYKQIGRNDEAIRDFTEAIRLAPRYMHPMYNPYEQRAQAKEAIGDAKGAAADRKTYFPLMDHASTAGDEIRGPNASGLRAWEPFIIR